MKFRYYIVRGGGKAYSNCKGRGGELVPAYREGSAWAQSASAAIDLYRPSHAGYFVGKVMWQARPMTDRELRAWEKKGVFPTF